MGYSVDVSTTVDFQGLELPVRMFCDQAVGSLKPYPSRDAQAAFFESTLGLRVNSAFPTGPPLVSNDPDRLVGWWSSATLARVGGGFREPQRNIDLRLRSQLESLRLPEYGSPPASWNSLRNTVTHLGGIGGVGVLADTGHVVLAISVGASAYICWLGTPAMRIVRRNLAERAATTLGTTPPTGDELR
jgi:hypothetical protein